MRRTLLLTQAMVAAIAIVAVSAQQPDAAQIAQERAQAEHDVPAGCCDAIFMRDVYHHITAPDAFNKSLFASLKPGGRLAIIDFVPRPGTALPAGVPANRGGHGIPPAVVVEEVTAAGFTHVRTIGDWPPGEKRPAMHLTLYTKPGN